MFILKIDTILHKTLFFKQFFYNIVLLFIDKAIHYLIFIYISINITKDIFYKKSLRLFIDT